MHCTTPSAHLALALLACALLCVAACADDDAASTDTSATDADAGHDAAAGHDADTTTDATPDASCTLTCAPPDLLDTTACACVTPPDDDLDPQAADFTCITAWPKVRRFHITNLLGRTQETLDVANNPDGGRYPVGTLIQLVPQEAMVKRHSGFSPATNDWEFFFLDVTQDGARIVSRGTTDVTNSFGGNCLDCHALAAPQWDLVCEQDHGCDPIPIGPDLIQTLQDADPRCP